MSRQDREALIKAWKDGDVVGPAGDVEMEDSDLENISGGGTTAHGTDGCCPTTHTACDSGISIH